MDNPVKMLRDTLGLSQAKFAHEIRSAGGQLTGGRVSQIEHGEGVLGPENLLIVINRYRVQIARLGLSTEDFLRRVGSRSAA